MSIHDLVVCVRQGKRRYHNRNHSEEFRCPNCGRQCRQNLNWLGNKKSVYCDGLKFHKLERQSGDWIKEQEKHIS